MTAAAVAAAYGSADPSSSRQCATWNAGSNGVWPRTIRALITSTTTPTGTATARKAKSPAPARTRIATSAPLRIARRRSSPAARPSRKPLISDASSVACQLCSTRPTAPSATPATSVLSSRPRQRSDHADTADDADDQPQPEEVAGEAILVLAHPNRELANADSSEPEIGEATQDCDESDDHRVPPDILDAEMPGEQREGSDSDEHACEEAGDPNLPAADSGRSRGWSVEEVGDRQATLTRPD